MSTAYGPKTVPDAWEFNPEWRYITAKHDLQIIWKNRNNGVAWVRAACRRSLSYLKSIRHLRPKV
jgi:hypothetical protein